MSRRNKVRIDDKKLLGALFFKMRTEQFFRIFHVEECEVQSILAIAAAEKAAKQDRAMNEEEWKTFKFYLKVIPEDK